MVIAKNSNHFHALASQFFKMPYVEEGIYAKYRYVRRYGDSDYVYKLIKDGSKRIFRMWDTDLITYDEEIQEWFVERHPTVTTVSWFNGVASSLKLPVWISVNNFFVKVLFKDLFGEPAEFVYKLPSKIKYFGFKDNKDLAKLVSDLSLRPHKKTLRWYYKKWKRRVSRGYEVHDPNRKYCSIKLRYVVDYEVYIGYDHIKYRFFGIKHEYSQSLAWLEQYWITKYLQDKPLSPKLRNFIELFCETRNLDDEDNKFAIKTKKHEIFV
ncbi:MAG: hypothetical protein DRJ03_26120, partial [Chloroflexi bacterium]